LGGALGQVYPESEEQRCWNHRIINILDKLPKKHHADLGLFCYLSPRPFRLDARLWFILVDTANVQDCQGDLEDNDCISTVIPTPDYPETVAK
jgi:transposase-like protein